MIICDHPERWDYVHKELPGTPIVLGDPASDEVSLPPESSAVGKEIGELELHRVSNALVVAYRDPDGQWRYNPPTSMMLQENSVLILLGSPSEVRAVCEHMGGVMVSMPATEGV